MDWTNYLGGIDIRILNPIHHNIYYMILLSIMCKAYHRVIRANKYHVPDITMSFPPYDLIAQRAGVAYHKRS